MTPTSISVCLITKNEHDNLKKCLQALTPYPFEIIVADTGSNDNTKEMAQGFGAKVFDFIWVNDFSAARNFSISQASNDWILVLDSDEFVRDLNYESLIVFMKEHPNSIGRIKRFSVDSEGGTTIDDVERFFDRRIYHYERAIHEQVLPIDADFEPTLLPIPITVDHRGYCTIDLAKQKSDRNIAILKQYLAKHPDDNYSYFQLGQAYYMIKDFKNAIPYFEKALSYNLAPEAEYVQMLIVSYGYSLIYSDRLTDAIAFLEQIYPLFNTYGDFVFLMGCCYIRSGEYLKAVSQFVRATTLTNYKGEGVTTYLALYNLGLLYDTLGEKDMAITFFEKAAPQYAPAQEQLERLTAQQ